MKVYVVMGSWEYDGFDDTKMKIFTDKLDAEVYKQELGGRELVPNTPYYDFVHVLERELYTEKTIT
jgi:hypothetical protein